jgi:hypothetical protein
MLSPIPRYQRIVILYLAAFVWCTGTLGSRTAAIPTNEVGGRKWIDPTRAERRGIGVIRRRLRSGCELPSFAPNRC